MTQAEYVAAEERAVERHEYLRGEVFAMTGSSLEHAALASALARDVGSALADKPCRVFSADARVRSEATNMTTYPDLSVVCGQLLPHEATKLGWTWPFTPVFEGARRRRRRPERQRACAVE